MMASIRIVLADDHTLFRAGIRALLADIDEVEVVAEAGDGCEALRLIDLHRPDVALVDIGMAGLNGLEVTVQVAVACLSVRVIILSMHAHEAYVLQALRAGAVGYLLKDADTVELGLALKVVMQGETYLSPAVLKPVVRGYVQHAGGMADELDRLSLRQRETLQLIAEGHTTQEIAYRLEISVKTVEKHRAQLMERLGIHDIAGLVRYAIRAGLVRTEQGGSIEWANGPPSTRPSPFQET
jgi:DNA-binding NarL/FixJ family response regulator